MDLFQPDHVRFRLPAGMFGWLLGFALLLAGCTPGQAAPTAAPTAAAPPRASSTPALTLAPTAAPRASATASACAQPGRIEQRQLSSAALPRPLQVRVYLPPCYDPRARQPYPLLVLLHGQGSQADQWERLGIAAAADRLIAQGAISPAVIALPQEDDTLGNPFESGYDRALVEDLLPWLAENYAACAGKTCRAIGGLSRGAAWAMYIGLSHPDLFGAIGAHSFPSFYGDENRLPILLRAIPAGHLPRIWMDTGTRDRYLSQARHYHELLKQYHVPHEWQLFEGEHEESYWSAHLEDYLRWYLPN